MIVFSDINQDRIVLQSFQNNPRNKVDILGYKGPHNEERFHESILRNLIKLAKQVVQEDLKQNLPN